VVRKRIAVNQERPPSVQRGSILWIQLTDPDGKNPKERPALLLSSNEKIMEGGELVVAAISTVFSRPIPSHWFELPSRPGGDPVTGLDQPCVVKSDWLKRVEATDVITELGMAPSRVVRQVLAYLREQAMKKGGRK
jgi:mRNA-degrading endonuclease toxin of MazEF toxin-antitoxin module